MVISDYVSTNGQFPQKDTHEDGAEVSYILCHGSKHPGSWLVDIQSKPETHIHMILRNGLTVDMKYQQCKEPVPHAANPH